MSENMGWITIVLIVVIMISITIIYAPDDDSGMPQ